MISYINVFILLLVSGCTTRHASSYQNDNYVEFVNNNKMGMKLDSGIIRDKDFRLQIPVGLQSNSVSVGGSFLHILNFDDNQKIVLLYQPIKKSIDKRFFNFPDRSFNLSFKDFTILCEKADIAEYIGEITMLRNRRFGMNKPNIPGFYVFYLNIKRSKINTFNYSINSIHF